MEDSTCSKDKIYSHAKLVLSRVVESAFGFIAINSYECRDKDAKDLFMSASAQQNNVIESFPDQPVKYKAFKSSVHLSVDCDLKAGTKILSCYGVVLPETEATMEPKMIQTSQNLIIDGRAKSSLWIFIPESCNGNCIIKEGCIQTLHGQEFLCYIEAKEDIKKGDILTLDFGAFKQNENFIFNKQECDCGYGKCALRSLKTFPCPFSSCVRNRIPCRTNQGLLSHLKKVHGEMPQPKQSTLKKEKAKPSFSCTFISNDKECGRTFSEKKYLNRHVKMIHERKLEVVCKQCGHKFLNQNNYFVHFTKNKNGCKKSKT